MNARRVLLLAAGALLVLAPAAFARVTAPGFVAGVGSTFATTGEPSGGGLSLSLSPMWNVEGPVSAGVTLFADDIGTNITPAWDPNSGASLGDIAATHRMTFGGAWRVDVDHSAGPRWAVGATGSWGLWRVQDDANGRNLGGMTTAGFSLGAGVRRPNRGGQALGLALRYHRLFADRRSGFRHIDRYATAALEWRWGGAPAER